MRFIAIAILVSCLTFGCRTTNISQNHKQPRLIVVLSFDQYRGDYVTRFASITGDKGFKRMQNEGAWYSHCYFGHAVTQTGPGHATLLTGCYAAKHGIVANNFCNAVDDECFYCATDAKGQASAWLMTKPTVGEVLKTTSPESKVVAVTIKDRAAVLMAGNTADAVVFTNNTSGNWETSTHYPTPRWLDDVSEKYSLANYRGQVWQTVLADSIAALDAAPWEGSLSDGSKTFPHHISTNDSMAVADAMLTPFSLEALFNVCMTSLHAEQLGRDSTPDMLLIGASTTDLVGHVFGPDSREVQELYVHADSFVERLIDTLDNNIGRDNYVLFVTSDHGVTPVPEYTRHQKNPGQPSIDAGRIHSKDMKALLEKELTQQYGKPPNNWVSHIYAPHVYLSSEAIAWANVSPDTVAQKAAEIIRTVKGVGLAFSTSALRQGECPPGADEALCNLLKNDLHPDHAGQVIMYPKPFWIVGSKTTTHGSPWEYDRWVPLLILGRGFGFGEDTTPVEPVDIAATIARTLGLYLDNVDGEALPKHP